jgi:hypothetical protein
MRAAVNSAEKSTDVAPFVSPLTWHRSGTHQILVKGGARRSGQSVDKYFVINILNSNPLPLKILQTLFG